MVGCLDQGKEDVGSSRPPAFDVRYWTLDLGALLRSNWGDMSNDFESAVFQAVVNLEGQYSIWPADRELPSGWESEGSRGTKVECLAHIGTIWTDMRPLGARTH